jgi:hypothetical protein
MMTIISRPSSHLATVTLHSHVTNNNKTNEKVATVLPLIYESTAHSDSHKYANSNNYNLDQNKGKAETNQCNVT